MRRRRSSFPRIEFRDATAAARNRDELGGAAAGIAPLRILFAHRETFGDGVKRPNKPAGSSHWLFRALADQLVELLDGRTLLGGRPLRAGDIAVLCRTNSQLVAVSEALRVAGVPSVALGDASVFESPEALMLEQLLRALAEPSDALALRVALVTPLIGRDSADILALNADEAEWDVWGERFQRWNERWRTSGVTAALRGPARRARCAGARAGDPRGRAVDDQSAAPRRAAPAGRQRDPPRPPRLVDWLHRLRTDRTLRAELGSEAAQIRLESDVHAVALTTIHKSKGLQYPVVFCPFQWEAHRLQARQGVAAIPRRGAAPDHRPQSPAVADSKARRLQELAAEEMRLLYVAMTRAQQLCVVFWGAINLSQHSALAALLHGFPRPHDRARPRDAKKIGQLKDAEMLADLQALVDAADGTIALEPLPRPRGLKHSSRRRMRLR